MKNFIFKSSKGLIKNDSISLGWLNGQINLLLMEQRHQRADLKDIRLMINKLLISKHLQNQVDEYFEEDETSSQTDDPLDRDKNSNELV